MNIETPSLRFYPVAWLVEQHTAKHGGTRIAAERKFRRWAENLPFTYREKRGGAWWVSESARLADGETVQAFLALRNVATMDGLTLPPGHQRWSEKDRQRFVDTHSLLKRFDAFRGEHPTLSAERCALLFAQSEHAQRTKKQGLRFDYRSICRYRARVTPGNRAFDGNVDARGRHSRASVKGRACSQAAWDFFCALYLKQNRLSVTECHKLTAATAAKEGWNWPAVRTIQKRVQAEISRPVEVYHREGERAYRAKCESKIQRDYNGIAAGEHWCGDERTCDFFVRVPCARNGWRLIRPKLTSWMDLRSRVNVGWTISELANSDTIVASFKAGAMAHGLPATVTIDNGEDYKAVGGKGKRKWADWDSLRIGKLFEQLTIAVHYCEPYTPWSKLIESWHGTMAESFDKYVPTYCGGTPAERPPDLNKRLKNVLDAPTLDDVRSMFDEWLKGYHATVHRGDGMNGLTPNLVMEQYRGTVRRCSRDTLDFLCTHIKGPLKVGRDGIRWNGILYGNHDERLYPLQGKQVYLRIDPASAERVHVCDLAGQLLCTVGNRVLTGATQEDVRKAAQHRARCRRNTREFMANREYPLLPKATQVMALKREAAQAAERKLAENLPSPAPETVALPMGSSQPIGGIVRRGATDAGLSANPLSPSQTNVLNPKAMVCWKDGGRIDRDGDSGFAALAAKMGCGPGRKQEPTNGQLLLDTFGGLEIREPEPEPEVDWEALMKRQEVADTGPATMHDAAVVG